MTPRLLPPERRPWLLGLAVALAYLVPALFLLGDYGPTYDAIRGDYPYGERLLGYLETGDERFLELRATEPAPRIRHPHPNFDVGRFVSEWAFPPGSLFSGLSCRLFWAELGWLPALSAHFLPAVAAATVLIFVVASFACARWGVLAGIVAGAALSLTPTFFGHSFNNAKDVPECCYYACAVLAGFLALERGDRRLWLAGGAFTGLALAQKANGLFLPIQLGLYLGGLHLHAWRKGSARPRFGGRDLAAASLAFLVAYYAVSPPFWPHPIEGPRRWLGEMIQAGNYAMRAGGSWGGAGISLDAPWSVLISVPIPILLLAAIGLLRPGLGFRARWLLFLSIGLPVGRHVIPGMRNYEGIRHFLEFLPFLCLAAGAGGAWLAGEIRRLAGLGPRMASLTVGAVALVQPAWAIAAAHPNQVTLTNAFASEPIPDAWANSYWQGLGWMSLHAEPNAQIYVPTHGFIALSAAPVRLRADLEIVVTPPAEGRGLPAYFMHLSHQNEALLHGLDLPDPVFETRVKGHPVLQVRRLEADARGEAFLSAWRRQLEKGKVIRQVRALLRRTPGLLRVLGPQNRALTRAEKHARLREALPEELYRRLEEVRLTPAQLLEEGEDDPAEVDGGR
jgi:hypothetical protein